MWVSLSSDFSDILLTGWIAKLVDIVALKPRYDFDAGLQQVDDSHKALKALVKEAIVAVVVDSHETLKNQSRMIEYIADHTEYLATNIAALSHAVEVLQMHQNGKVRLNLIQIVWFIESLETQLAQTINWSGNLIDALLPGVRSEWEETTMWERREFRLAPKDHWEVNGILDFLQEWKELVCPSILAIFGPSEDRDTWVTEFSLDLIQACKLQGGLVASVMCDRPNNQRFTPSIVIRTLICQLLEQNPRLILEAPGILNLRVFRRIQGFNHVCLLFESVVATLAIPLTVIIDRVDCCEADLTDENESQNLLEFLSQLVTNHPQHLKVILTSGDELPEGENLSAKLAISTCMIASRKRTFRKEAFKPVHRRTKFGVYIRGPIDETYRQVLGLEQLYRMRGLMQTHISAITWTENLVPKTPRQKMICRYFGFSRPRH